MQKAARNRWLLGSILLVTFLLWTFVLQHVDVAAVGPNDSSVGLSTINAAFHHLTGVHMGLYVITDWLGLVPIATVLVFATLGLVQWIKRKSLRKVDRSLLILGGFYIVVMASYILFEYIVINYRPVLISGYLEASYPSSTTMLVLCVAPTAILQLRQRVRHRRLMIVMHLLIAAFTVFMVIGRLICGVHWLTDIIGGILLSGGLVLLYDGVVRTIGE